MAEAADRLKGTVKWFDVRRGFGFILPENGSANFFFHHSSIKAAGFRSLAVGEAVEFVASVGDDGRRRAINITGPGGAYIKDKKYFNGICYRCGELGHMAINCKSNGAVAWLGPCYSCGKMGHLARECHAVRIESSSGQPNLLKPSIQGSIKPLSSSMVVPSDSLQNIDSKSMDSYNEEEEDDDYNDDYDDDEDDEYEEFRKGEARNWAELPRDVLTVVFMKIGAVQIIGSAQYVCRPWRKLSYEPEIWRCIYLKDSDEFWDENALDLMAIATIDRSKGCVEEFYAEQFGSDELIAYISERAPKMRCLRLISLENMSSMALAQAVRKFPLLEEIELSFCYFSEEIVKLVGHACPQLKSFKLNGQPERFRYDSYQYTSENLDTEALAIASHMQQLSSLQLIENSISDIGLMAILNHCPNLQHLDIRGCSNVKMNENMKKKCSMIKDMRFPNQSISDYEFFELTDGKAALDSDFDHSFSDTEFDFHFGDAGLSDFDEFSESSFYYFDD